MKKISLSFVMALLVGVSAQARTFPKELPGTFNKAGAASQNVVYFGGPVISHVQIYVVLWGNGVDSATAAAMPDFYASIANSDYMDFLKVYNTTHITAQDGVHAGTEQTIGRGSFIQSIVIQPAKVSGVLDNAEIQAELVKQMDAGKIPPATADSLYMIHFPKGLTITTHDGATVMTSCKQFCAFHDGFQPAKGSAIYYGVIPNLDSFSCSLGCGMGASSLARITISSSHELIEAISDPIPTPGSSPAFPQAWNTLDGQEIGDLCQSSKGTLKGHAATYSVQQEWDNSISGCTKGNYTSN